MAVLDPSPEGDIRPLFGPHGYAVAVALNDTHAAGKKLTPFGEREAFGCGGAFSFGLDKEAVIETLRSLATDIESGRVVLQSYSSNTSNAMDDYELSDIRIGFAIKHPTTP